MAWGGAAPTGTGEHGSAGGQAGGQAGGAGPGRAWKPSPEFFAKRQKVSVDATITVAEGLCGLIALFVIIHWTRLIVVRMQRSRVSPVPRLLTKPVVAITRPIRNVLVRKVPGFNSAGHGLLVAAYVGINCAALFTNVDWSPGSVAARFGWVLSANYAFVVFLALKNTPLAFLTAYSYERLNSLHQIAGVATFLLLVVHGVTYTAYFGSTNKWHVMREETVIAGIVAGFAFLSIFLSAIWLRRVWYEAFYIVHWLSFVGSVVAVAFHRPDWKSKTPIILCVISGMWATDRLIRLTRVLLYSINNYATLTPLPNGGTRIVLTKPPAMAVPGKHCLVWIPGVRMLETHPFTIISTNPLEFVVNSYDGFTRDLHARAVAHPGVKLRASVEGPYGTFPDPMQYDKIILIAGGSGASYTFGLAVNLLQRMSPSATKEIVFLWAFKTHENLTWFSEHLNTLRTHAHSPKVSVALYVTRAPGSSSSAEGHGPLPPIRLRTVSSQSSEILTENSPSDIEKAVLEAASHIDAHGTSTDPEKAAEEHHHSHARHEEGGNRPHRPGLHHTVSSGRPDISTLISEAISSTDKNRRVLVAACGPDSLLRVARNSTASAIRLNGPGVELHCEQFGW